MIRRQLAALKIITSRIQKPQAEVFKFWVWIFKESRLGSERLALQMDLPVTQKGADRIVIHSDCFSAWFGAANG